MNGKQIVAIVQARMKSTRLPGKVLREINGRPILEWVINRLVRTETITQTVVATTTDSSDDIVEEFCRQRGYACYRGDMHDVLDRFFQAARWFSADVVVRVTADCPIIDPVLVDETVQAFLGLDAADGPFDFAANRLPPPFTRTYPIGLDTEVCSFAALERAWHEADRPFHREHVMPFFYEGIESPLRIEKLHNPGYLDIFESPRGFKVLLLNHNQDLGDYRWTVDTPMDLTLLDLIVSRLGGSGDFTWQEVLDFVNGHPELHTMNASTYHKDFRESERGS